MPDPVFPDLPFVMRATAVFVVSTLLLATGLVFSEKRYTKSPPLWTVIVLLLVSVAGTFAAGALGAAAAVTALHAMGAANDLLLRAAILIGVLAGIWSESIIIQLLCNLLRPRLGLPKRKLELLRIQRRKRKRRASGGSAPLLRPDQE